MCQIESHSSAALVAWMEACTMQALPLFKYKKNKRHFLGHFTLSNLGMSINCRG